VRILHSYKVFPPDIMGGIPEAITCLAKGMLPRHESLVLVARSRGRGRRYRFDGIPVEAVASLGTIFSSPISPSFPFALASRSRKVDVAVLHHPFPLNDIGATFGIPTGTALIVHWHAEIVRQQLLTGLVAPFIHRSLARAQRIILSHPSLLSESPFLAACGKKSSIIPYGIDVSYWNELDSSQQRKAKELRSRYPRLVIATGRLVAYKGFRVLIEALRQLDATAIIVGDGPLRGDLLQAARQLGLNDRIILAGTLSRDDLKFHLHAARLYALPSVSAEEAFGIVQLEAMAAALPIVNTVLPTGVPWVARHELEALTVPPNDPAALAAAIRRLLDNRELARRLGAAGRARAMAEYSMEVFVKRTEEVYAEVVNEWRGRRAKHAPSGLDNDYS
jgi:glycosyltransferase involved in cell wall biosynthesis